MKMNNLSWSKVLAPPPSESNGRPLLTIDLLPLSVMLPEIGRFIMI